ncbi:MAG: N-acetylmuramoyl-L-alanine amidase [Bdellovibrionales bacterium]
MRVSQRLDVHWICVWLLAGVGFFLPVSQAAPLRVVVDPGHGGKDHGTHRGTTFESHINLAVAKKLMEKLTADSTFSATLTRDRDTTMTLSRRGKMAKEFKADVLLSIHVNSSPDSRAKGAEFYFQNQLPPDEESLFLAHKENSFEDMESEALPYDFLEANTYPNEVSFIVTDLLNSHRVWRSSQVAKYMKVKWRGTRKSQVNSVRQAPFFLLSNLTVPSTLVEIGYLTNSEDFRQLTDPGAQNRIAEDLYRGLRAYKESVDKKRSGF